MDSLDGSKLKDYCIKGNVFLLEKVNLSVIKCFLNQKMNG